MAVFRVHYFVLLLSCVRALHTATWIPIRIQAEFDGDVEATIRLATSQAALLVSRFLLVPSNSSEYLLLPRKACKTHVLGKTEQCVELRNDFRREMCLEQPIPDRFLSALRRYDSDGRLLEEIKPAGPGTSNCDFLLFVGYRDTKNCSTRLAYASFCKQSEDGRPIAGFVNVCPAAQLLDVNRLGELMLHEILHAIGFTGRLLDRMHVCDASGCRKHAHPVKRVYGAQRMVTPEVARAATDFFNCSDNPFVADFGPMIETSTDDYASHWDQRFARDSIMTSNISAARFATVDPLTLAFFRDSGWFRVDPISLRSLPPYFWGKGAGCEFAKYPSCLDDAKFFCRTGGEKRCHYLHRHIGRCHIRNGTCGIVQPTVSCLNSSDDPFPSLFSLGNFAMAADLPDGEWKPPEPPDDPSNIKSRGACFMVKEPNSAPTPRCLSQICVRTSERPAYVRLYVAGQRGEWIPCPSGRTVSGIGGLTVVCPDNEILCFPQPPPFPVVPPHNAVSSTPTPEPEPEPDSVCFFVTYQSQQRSELMWHRLQRPLHVRVELAYRDMFNSSALSSVSVLHMKPISRFMVKISVILVFAAGVDSEKFMNFVLQSAQRGQPAVSVPEVGGHFFVESAAKTISPEITDTYEYKPKGISMEVVMVIVGFLVLLCIFVLILITCLILSRRRHRLLNEAGSTNENSPCDAQTVLRKTQRLSYGMDYQNSKTLPSKGMGDLTVQSVYSLPDSVQTRVDGERPASIHSNKIIGRPTTVAKLTQVPKMFSL